MLNQPQISIGAVMTNENIVLRDQAAITFFWDNLVSNQVKAVLCGANDVDVIKKMAGTEEIAICTTDDDFSKHINKSNDSSSNKYNQNTNNLENQNSNIHHEQLEEPVGPTLKKSKIEIAPKLSSPENTSYLRFYNGCRAILGNEPNSAAIKKNEKLKTLTSNDVLIQNTTTLASFIDAVQIAKNMDNPSMAQKALKLLNESSTNINAFIKIDKKITNILSFLLELNDKGIFDMHIECIVNNKKFDPHLQFGKVASYTITAIEKNNITVLTRLAELGIDFLDKNEFLKKL